MCVLCGTMVLCSTFLLDQYSGGGMHAMLGTLPRMLVLESSHFISVGKRHQRNI